MELSRSIPLFALLLLGCKREQWDDCITSTGPTRVEQRTLEPYTGIDLGDQVDLVLEQRTAGAVAVEAGANLIGQVTTVVEDGTLHIRNGMTCNWVRRMKPRMVVHVPVEGFEKLTVRGTGNVSCRDTIVRDRFELEQWGAQGSASLLLKVTTCAIGLHTGAGDVRAVGHCSATANLFSGIQAPIDAHALKAPEVNVNNSGIADIRCWATERLNVQLHDVGDVYYTGDPQVSSVATGSGRLYRE